MLEAIEQAVQHCYVTGYVNDNVVLLPCAMVTVLGRFGGILALILPQVCHVWQD